MAQIRQQSSLPILGQGGISSWEDAAQYIAVGADAVEVCTEVMLNGYQVIGPMLKGLQNYLEEQQFDSILDLKNKAIEMLSTHEALPKKPLTYPCIDAQTCVRCGKCVMICQESEHQALQLVNGAVKVDKKRCVGCGLCRFVCPVEAISKEQI